MINWQGRLASMYPLILITVYRDINFNIFKQRILAELKCSRRQLFKKINITRIVILYEYVIK